MSSSLPPCPTHLVIVCCHAIYLGGQPVGPSNEANWLIEPFQTGETETYIQHIKAGVRELAEDRHNAILVFSGGVTKAGRTARSEAEGYLDIALQHNLFHFDTPPQPPGQRILHNLFKGPDPSTHTHSLRQRIFLDKYATDSYQNIFSSLIQFPLFVRELQQRLGREASEATSSDPEIPSPTPPPQSPSTPASAPASMTDEQRPQPLSDPASEIKLPFPIKLTIISHAFKCRRFLHLHFPALHFSLARTTYVGIDPPFSATKLAEIEEGEGLRGYGAWERDFYGAGEVLKRKREARGWDTDVFRREVLERFGDRDLRRKIEELMGWEGGDDGREIYPGRTPWE